MINPNVLEDAYKEFSKKLLKWVPDGYHPSGPETAQRPESSQ